MDNQNKREFKILSIDGGGVRGIIPSTILAEIEKSMKEPLWKYFDLICGTSTGGIIALGIATGKKMKDIKELYDSKVNEIFPSISKWSYHKKLFRFGKILFGDGGRYNPDSLEKILKNEFQDEGQLLKMKDAKTRLCIPSIDITNGKVVIYKTPHKINLPKQQTLENDSEKEIWEVARATSAAPTFFKTAKIKDSYFIDGGMWANNPSLVGVIEAIRCGYELNEISLLSLGTGNEIFQVEQAKAEKMNLNHWGISGLIELSFEIQSQAVHNEVNCLLSPERYLRIQHNFKKNIALDDISRLSDLRAAAQDIYKNKSDDIKNKFFNKILANKNYKEI